MGRRAVRDMDLMVQASHSAVVGHQARQRAQHQSTQQCMDGTSQPGGTRWQTMALRSGQKRDETRRQTAAVRRWTNLHGTVIAVPATLLELSCSLSTSINNIRSTEIWEGNSRG